MRVIVLGWQNVVLRDPDLVAASGAAIDPGTWSWDSRPIFQVELPRLARGEVCVVLETRHEEPSFP